MVKMHRSYCLPFILLVVKEKEEGKEGKLRFSLFLFYMFYLKWQICLLHQPCQI